MITIDPPTLRKINTLHPSLRAEVIALWYKCAAAGIIIRITEALRSTAYQNCLFAQGRETFEQVNARRAAISLPAIGHDDAGTIVTKARGGTSWHNYGVAFDFALLVAGGEVSWNEKLDLDKDGVRDWAEVVNIMISAGYEWGGGAAFIAAGIRDAPHFQKRFGLTIKLCQAKVAAKQVDTAGYILLK